MRALSKIMVRMAIFIIVGLIGTYVLNKGSVIWGQIAITSAAFFAMNIIYEIYNKFSREKI